MRKLILNMAITVDGLVAPEDEGVFNHSDQSVWKHIFGLLESVDGMLIGAGMHQEYLSYWQTQLTHAAASANERKYAEIATRTPHFVLSRTLRKLDWPNTTIVAGLDAVSELKQRPGRDIMMWGGAAAAAAVLEAGLVDELHLVTHPVIGGRGKKLFANVNTTQRLRHRQTKSIDSGIVVLTYGRA